MNIHYNISFLFKVIKSTITHCCLRKEIHKNLNPRESYNTCYKIKLYTTGQASKKAVDSYLQPLISLILYRL